MTSKASRPMRSDAVTNRARLIEAARAVFEEEGPGASLNQVAQRAGVGSGTLYRHFPTLDDLVVGVVGDDVEALCARGRALASGSSPGEALRAWLHAVADHATSLRGLVAVQMATAPRAGTGAALAACHEAISSTAAMLLRRAQEAGLARRDVDARDLLALVNAIAWASEQARGDDRLLERLLALAAHGFAPTVAPPDQQPRVTPGPDTGARPAPAKDGGTA